MPATTNIFGPSVVIFTSSLRRLCPYLRPDLKPPTLSHIWLTLLAPLRRSLLIVPVG